MLVEGSAGRGRQRGWGVAECSGVDTSGRARSFHRSILDSFLMSAKPPTNTLPPPAAGQYSVLLTEARLLFWKVGKKYCLPATTCARSNCMGILRKEEFNWRLANKLYKRLRNVCLQEIKALLTSYICQKKTQHRAYLNALLNDSKNTGTFGYLYAIGVALQYSEFTKVSLQLTK